MAKYIEAEELELAFIEKGQASKRYKIGEFWELNGAEIREVINSQPTVEVVRCKDCADWQTDWIPSRGGIGSHYCGTMDTMTKPNDYCSYGERRKE